MSHFILISAFVKKSSCILVADSPVRFGEESEFFVTPPTSFNEIEDFFKEVWITADDSHKERSHFIKICDENDTADELISPYCVINNWPASLQPFFNKLSLWLAESINNNQLSNVALVFTEGLDSSYRHIQVSLPDLAQTLLTEFESEARVPSLFIEIK
jgi:hypothetical protein